MILPPRAPKLHSRREHSGQYRKRSGEWILECGFGLRIDKLPTSFSWWMKSENNSSRL
jgi:ABC-type phosphonate transport system ATPase subunit